MGEKTEKEGELFCLQQQNCVSEVLTESEHHEAADFLSPFPMFIKIMSCMLGNALYSISSYSCERHAAERKEEVGNCTEMFYILREREEY